MMHTRAWQSRRRIAAAAGLLAMLLQLCVSFGHVHADQLGGRSTTLLAVRCDASPCRSHVPVGFPDDDCPICAAVHMAATGLIPAPPSLAAPAQFVAISQRPIFVSTHLAVRRHSPFQTRAPPAA
jgi:hypothetical protein